MAATKGPALTITMRLEPVTDGFTIGLRFYWQADDSKEGFEVGKWSFWLLIRAPENVGQRAGFDGNGFPAVGCGSGDSEVPLEGSKGRFHGIRLSDRFYLLSR